MKKRKKRVKFKSILIILGIFVLVGLVIFIYTNMHIKNIYVIGNKYLSEQEIIDMVDISDYPKIIDVSSNNIQNELLKNVFINNANVSKSILGTLIITVSENKILYENNKGEYILSSGEIVHLNKEVIGIPSLINEVDENILSKLLNKLMLVSDSIMVHISQISYTPTELDNERFLLYMTDGNYVYITLSKIELINSYNEILLSLDNNKGILYLDSGNHFEIKKKSN